MSELWEEEEEEEPMRVSPPEIDPVFRFMSPEEAYRIKGHKTPSMRILHMAVFPDREQTLHQLVIRSGRQFQVIQHPIDTNVDTTTMPFHEDTFRNIMWSPRGTFLLHFDYDEVILWGGAHTSTPLVHCTHLQVKLAAFSPCEKYLVTYKNPYDVIVDRTELVLKIFNVFTGEMMIGGTGPLDEASWPVIRWAGGVDDKYFAMLLDKNTVSIYDTTTFTLLGEEPMRFFDDDCVDDISWSPTDPILALLQGTKVSLVKFPAKEYLIQKNLPSLGGDCKMYWQSNGKYLAVKGDTGFEIFRFSNRSISSVPLALDNKILAFAWEPKGDRFAVIHGDDQPMPNVSFYSMETRKVSKLTTLEAKKAKALFWSPTGKHIIISGLKGFRGHMEFFDVDRLEIIGVAKDLYATHIAWDPTGSFVATAKISDPPCEHDIYDKPNDFVVNPPRPSQTHGIRMWSCSGQSLYAIKRRYPLLQLDWRP